MYNPDEECKAMVAALKKLCEQKGMSPHALAKEAGISTSTISYLMKGKTRPQVYTVLELCNVLGVSINELFSRAGTDVTAETGIQYITCDEKKLLDCYRGLSEKKKELLRIYVDMLRQYEGIIAEE
ncbi:MAG: helix-turn-helix transcriptional regulator [Eubacterium sp.]|nr:helix-turn-helix transcriptional regulator [Eubacterium sp.]